MRSIRELGRSKRPMAAGAAALSALLVAACGAGATSGSSSGSNSSIFIQGVSRYATDPFVITEGCAEAAEAKALGVKFSFDASPTLDAATEITHWDADLLKHPDGIVLGPPNASAMVGQIQQASAQGIPVAVMNTGLSAQTGYKVFPPDWSHLGDLVAPLVLQAVGAQGTLGLIGDSPDNPNDMARWEAVQVAVHNAYPGITILPVQYGQTSSSTSAQVTEQMVAAHLDLGAIFVTNGPEGNGVESALAALHATEKVKVIVIDASPTTLDGLRSGAVYAAIAQRPWVMGQEALKSVVEYVKAHRGSTAPVTPGKPYLNPVPLTLVTKQNVDKLTVQTGLYVSSCPK